MITLRRLAAAEYKGLQAIDLRFPERGSFLIEGRNEAGKSTLFDAIHFALYGQPLVGDIAEAIHYGGEQTEVRLELEAGGTALSVRRRARQTAKALRSEAELEVRRGDDAEKVIGAGAVTQRLRDELGGLTAEALLNSCLVAQKELGRLETLDRSKREQALTILLNLGKLTDVHGRLRPKPDDDVRLRQARARVELARVTADLARVETQRGRAVRLHRLLDVRDGTRKLDSLQQTLAQARASAAEQEARLTAVRADLAALERLEARAESWQRAAEAARQALAARQELAAAETQVADARAAAAALPERTRELEDRRQARAQAQELADCQATLARLGAEADRVAKRLEQRAASAARIGRLDGELEAMRRQRRDLAAQVQQLAPLAGEMAASRARLDGLRRLEQALDEIQEQRRALEQLEATAAERAEADAGVLDAQAVYAEARATLAAHEQRRREVEARDRLQRLHAALAAWLEHHTALAAARQARRLLADLALAIAGVEHVTVRPPAAEATAGLHLNLVVDHPITGPAHLQLRLWAGGAELTAARPATAAEAQGLKAGGLPSLSAADDADIRAALKDTAQQIAELGGTAPKQPEQAQRQLDEVARALAAPAPERDEEAYTRARAEALSAQERLRDAIEAAGVLPEAAALARDVERLRRQIVLLEQASVVEATRWQVLGPDTESIQRAIPHAVMDEQQRRDDLASRLGQRDGLLGQLDTLDGSGKERKRELEECQADLATDSEPALYERQQHVTVERAAAEARAVQLLEALAAALSHGPSQEETRAGSILAAPAAPAVGVGAETVDVWTASAIALETAAAESGATTGNGRNGRSEPPADGAALASLDVAGLRERTQAEMDAAQRDVAVLEEHAGTLSGAEMRLADAREAAAEHDQSLRQALDAAAPGEEGNYSLPDGTDPAAARELAQNRCDTLRAGAARYDRAALREAERDAQRRADSAEDTETRTLEEARALVAGLARVLEELGHAVPEDEALDGLEPGPAAARIRELCPEAAGDLPAREDTDKRIPELDQEVGRLKGVRQDALLVLGPDAAAAVPDRDAAQRDLEALELDLTARRRAMDIVAKTRQRMIEKVLPDTITNMCLLLPHLTAGRYRYAELTPEYRLQVWDERKRGYVEKNLYSGGTQDQFSLALRLGFALAALPRELGTSPGFLFLDEPLSSFDRDRTAALVDLLTHGQIATFFQQVFLISHSEAFDRDLFRYYIRMEEGQVVESTLPIASAGSAAPVESAP